MAERIDLNERFAYHPPITDGVRKEHEAIRINCRDLAGIFKHNLPESREKSLAVTKIEEAMFWANAAIARHQDDGQDDGAEPANTAATAHRLHGQLAHDAYARAHGLRHVRFENLLDVERDAWIAAAAAVLGDEPVNTAAARQL